MSYIPIEYDYRLRAISLELVVVISKEC